MSSLRTLASYLGFRSRKFADRAALERWQERRIQKHLRWVCGRSSWFEKLAREYSIDRWREWPIRGKAEMVNNIETWCTAPIIASEAWRLAEDAMRNRDFSPMLPGGISVGMSSGTSGCPGLFFASKSERAEWAGAILARVLPEGLLAKKWRLALFLRANSNLYQATHGRQVNFRFFDLAGEIERHRKELDEFAPHILAAPPRVLVHLAKARAAGELALAPDRIVSVAEVLEPWMRAQIEESFGTPCHQIYQATEGFLGVTCAHGTLHLNEDIAVIERESVGSGSVFRPIVTDFRRRTQPIIRYRMEDLLRPAATPCPCGSPFLAIEEIIGRSDETCVLVTEQGESREVLPDFLRLAAASVLRRDFRLVNHAPGKIRVEADRLTTKETEALAAKLGAACATSGCVPAELSFGALEIPCWKEKFRRVVRWEEI